MEKVKQWLGGIFVRGGSKVVTLFGAELELKWTINMLEYSTSAEDVFQISTLFLDCDNRPLIMQ